MDIRTLGTKLSSSKVTLSIRENSKFQQGNPIDPKEMEFVNIAQLLYEFKNKLSIFEVNNDYLIASSFLEDSFLVLCVYHINKFKSTQIRHAEFQNLLSQIQSGISDSIESNWKKFGFNRKRSLDMNTFRESGFSDNNIKSEHLLYLSKYFDISFAIIDYENLERENYGEGENKLLFKKEKSHYQLYVGTLPIKEKITSDLSKVNCPLLTSSKISHTKKLAKLLN